MGIMETVLEIPLSMKQTKYSVNLMLLGKRLSVPSCDTDFQEMVLSRSWGTAML